MARTIVIQLILFLLPFLGYAFYRMLLSDAQAEGRKTWPISALFGAGAVLAISGFVFLALNEERMPDMCHQPARYENGELIPARSVPCERDMTKVGAPARDRTGPSQNAPEIDPEPAETPDTPQNDGN